MTHHSTPPHLREAVFRRWEPVLAAALRSSTPFIVPLDTLAPTTAIAQLRSAIRSHRTYNWPSPLDPERLAALSVRWDGLDVVIQQRAAAQQPPAAAAVAELTLNIPNLVALCAVFTLCAARVLTAVVVHYADAAELEQTARNYDVVCTKLGDNTYRII